MPRFPEASILGRLDNNIFTVGAVIEVIETAALGVGTLSMVMRGPSVNIRLRRTIPWLSQQKCGDAVIFEFLDARLVIHLVELKSTITPDEWDKVRDQLHGAYHNALAVAGVLEAARIDEVRIHIAYMNDRMSPKASAVPSSLKAALGRPHRTDVTDWVDRRMRIDDRRDIPINLIQRGPDGHAAAQIA